MEFAVLGWPEDGPTLELDWRRFSYAGKFVMSSTGKTVARDADAVVGAVAFNEDRSTDGRAWIRYVTVREDARGQGIGPRLTAYTVTELLDRYESVRTAANNPYSYESFYKAGFAFTGETTGIEGLVLERGTDAPPSVEQYRAGLDRLADRDLTEAERTFLAEKRRAGPPARVDPPKGED
ncbi:MAG: GNAT family N-acetyltransferase [Halanaeroarchaeum sp.]